MAYFLEDFVKAVREENLVVNYAEVWQDGSQVDFWSRFQKAGSDGMSAFKGVSRQESYSLSKSFTSIGIGIALDEGLLSLDERLADSFPELTDVIQEPEVLAVTVEDLLRMASGMSKPMFFRDSDERRQVKDWFRYIYETEEWDLRRGRDFLYNNVNPYLLGCLLERKTGQNLLEYMRHRLFEPLDIGNPDMTQCPMGHTVAANGLDINCHELTRFGQMLLNKGEFNGHRIVSADYVEKALSPQIRTGKKSFWPSDDEYLDYGYQFWVDQANHCSFAWGILGQFCLILPERKAVVSVQSLDAENDRIGELLWKYIVEKL